MTDTLHILGVSGSLRKASRNTYLLRAAAELTPDHTEIEIYSIGDLPLYNQDLITNHYPAPVEAWRNKVRAADAILFTSPEYNHSLTAALKNALDWASRVDLNAAPGTSHLLDQKPGAVMGAGGRSGTIRSQNHFHQIATALNMQVLHKPQVFVPLSPISPFNEAGELIDPLVRTQIQKLLAELALWTRHLQAYQNSTAPAKV